LIYIVFIEAGEADEQPFPIQLDHKAGDGILAGIDHKVLPYAGIPVHL
jgi:hypothetical protein